MESKGMESKSKTNKQRCSYLQSPLTQKLLLFLHLPKILELSFGQCL